MLLLGTHKLKLLILYEDNYDTINALIKNEKLENTQIVKGFILEDLNRMLFPILFMNTFSEKSQVFSCIEKGGKLNNALNALSSKGKTQQIGFSESKFYRNKLKNTQISKLGTVSKKEIYLSTAYIESNENNYSSSILIAPYGVIENISSLFLEEINSFLSYGKLSPVPEYTIYMKEVENGVQFYLNENIQFLKAKDSLKARALKYLLQNKGEINNLEYTKEVVNPQNSRDLSQTSSDLNIDFEAISTKFPFIENKPKNSGTFVLSDRIVIIQKP